MPGHPERITTYPPAKVNLSLEVLGRRPDGYHELCTVFQAISLRDELTCEIAEGLTLMVEGDAPGGEDNLVLRAARALREHAPGKGAAIQLNKQIPSGAGLGGGSSDAAAALLILHYLWQPPVDHAQLVEIGRGLGADVPFFLYGGTALGMGRGDVIDPLVADAHAPDRLGAYPPTEHGTIVLAIPSFTLPAKTARIFRALRSDEYSDGSRTLAIAEDLRGGRLPRQEQFHNALLAPALRVFGQLGEYLATLRRLTGREWSLSGAGPTFFTLAESVQDGVQTEFLLRDLPGQCNLVSGAKWGMGGSAAYPPPSA